MENGLKKINNFEWNIPGKTNKFMLKYAGLWPHGDTYKSNIYTWYAITVSVFFICVHAFSQAFNIFFIDDLSVATAIIFVALSDIISVLKVHAIFGNMKTLKKLIKTINTPMFLPKTETQRAMVKSNINSWKRFYNIFLILATATVAFWAVFPILDGTLQEYRLPFVSWYPYNYHQDVLYEITYVHQMISVTFIASIHVNVDGFIAALMMIVGAECDILCDDLRNLYHRSNVAEDFINCVKHHREILKFAEDSNAVFDFIVLTQFVTSAVSLAMTMFQLTVVEPLTNEFYSFLLYEIAITVQIFMYCWFGNEVQFKSNNIPNAAYEFDWTETSLQVKKHLVLFIARTQQPIRPSALNLFYLSLDTFTSILRTGWSYFAVLHQVNTTE